MIPRRKKVLIVVDGDAGGRRRAAEALRLAAGLATWRKNEITVCLTGDGAGLLDENAGHFADEDIRLAWPVIREAGVTVYSDAGTSTRAFPVEGVRKIGPGDFSRLASEADYCLRF